MMVRLSLCLVSFFLLASTTTAAFAPPQLFGTTTDRPRTSTSISRPLQATAIDTSFMWNRGLNFGKGQFKFYKGFDQWMSVFPEEDRKEYPEVFNFPAGVYEVELEKPLGVVFEEIDMGKGLYVQDLVEGGNAERQGIIQQDDVLVGITATKVVGAKYERRLIPARKFDFDTMVGAVESNAPRFGCESVILAFERPSEADPAKTDEFMSFFEPPFDNPWKQQQ